MGSNIISRKIYVDADPEKKERSRDILAVP